MIIAPGRPWRPDDRGAGIGLLKAPVVTLPTQAGSPSARDASEGDDWEMVAWSDAIDRGDEGSLTGGFGAS
jgi:hypothetical protein